MSTPIFTVPYRVATCPICWGPLWCQVLEHDTDGRVLEVSTYCPESVEFDNEAEHRALEEAEYAGVWLDVLTLAENWARTQRLDLELTVQPRKPGGNNG